MNKNSKQLRFSEKIQVYLKRKVRKMNSISYLHTTNLQYFASFADVTLGSLQTIYIYVYTHQSSSKAL